MLKKLKERLTRLLNRLAILELPPVIHAVHRYCLDPIPARHSPFAFLAQQPLIPIPPDDDIPMEDRLFIADDRLINYIPNNDSDAIH
jgi:hypothetical protein